MAYERLRTAIILSVCAALLTLGLKTATWILTDSVGLLSDAIESCINLFAAVVAFFSLQYSNRPIDAGHTYGHEKIEFLSSGLEGILILGAAVSIACYAVLRLIHPQPLQQLGLGMVLALVASCVNLGVGLVLLRIGKKYNSIILQADGQHLMTDVWTSVAVVGGLGLVWLTDVWWLDPVVALLIAANIVWTAAGLLRRSFDGLMDHALPQEDLARIREVIRGMAPVDVQFHALRSRRGGRCSFVDFHLLVPGRTSVAEAHQTVERIEEALRAQFPDLEVTIQVEPIEARGSWEDSALLAIEADQENSSSAKG